MSFESGSAGEHPLAGRTLVKACGKVGVLQVDLHRGELRAAELASAASAPGLRTYPGGWPQGNIQLVSMFSISGA